MIKGQFAAVLLMSFRISSAAVNAPESISLFLVLSRGDTVTPAICFPLQAATLLTARNTKENVQRFRTSCIFMSIRFKNFWQNKGAMVAPFLCVEYCNLRCDVVNYVHHTHEGFYND